jgi:hypothetical protein
MGRNPWNSLLFVSSVKPPLKHPAFRRLNGGHMRSWSTTFRPQFCHRIGTTPCWSWHYPRHPPAPISSRKLSSPKGGDSELQKMMFHQTTEIYWNILIFIISMYIYISLYIIWMVLQSWHFISWNIQIVHQMPIDAVGLSGNLLFPTESDHQRWDTQSGLSTAKRFIFSALYCMFQRQNGYILCFIHTYAR